MMKRNSIGRRELLQVGAVGAASAVLGTRLAGGAAEARKRRPNVLFIFTDQQSQRAMSCAGNKWLKTRHMDSIAANGVSFENSYCTSPVCSPSRSSLLTGRMPHETGVNVNNKPIKSGIPNMGEVFRAAGYETAYTGKWHLPTSYPWGVNAEIPGFDYLVPKLANPSGWGAVADGPVTDRAVEFLKRRHDKPFLLAVSLHNPHDICGWIRTNPGQHPDLDKFPPLPANHAIDPNEPEFIRLCRQRKRYGTEIKRTVNWTDDHWRIYLNAYYRFNEDVDKQVGRILAALREQGLEEDTLIVFTSDHGEGMGGHKWVVKLMLYEEPVTVPIIVSWKGVTPGGVVDKTHLVSGVDVLPTICDYAGVRGPQMTGKSLRKVIEKSELQGSEFVVSELAPYLEDLNRCGRMLRTARYKYVIFSEGEIPEMLFDMKDDPGETKNLAYDSGMAMTKVVEQHRELLGKWIERTGDYFKMPV
ncbi:MAG: sulfatase-like hydrolase/transferase [Planctomycetota bacterium]|nr:MAG: sulfatase-like hydrolase/transferase [Planctomycetota bacterium]